MGLRQHLFELFWSLKGLRKVRVGHDQVVGGKLVDDMQMARIPRLDELVGKAFRVQVTHDNICRQLTDRDGGEKA